MTSPKNIVLYADDDADDLLLVEEAFTRHAENVQLETVTDGTEALSFLKNIASNGVKPCLIILDINMPRLNGRETLIALREIPFFDNVPVILFSTSSQPIDKTFAANYNAGFITKPIDFTQMEYIINTFIDHCAEEIKENIRRKA